MASLRYQSATMYCPHLPEARFARAASEDGVFISVPASSADRKIPPPGCLYSGGGEQMVWSNSPRRGGGLIQAGNNAIQAIF